MNKVELRGNLKADPTIDYLQSGDPVMSFTLCVNGARWSQRENRQVVTTAFIRCRMYADQVAEMLDASLEPGQGDDVYLVGQLEQVEVPKESDPEKKERKTGVTVFELNVIRRRRKLTAETKKDPWA